MDLVKPSAIFPLLRTKPMSEMTRSRNASLAAAMSSIKRISDVRVPFEMTSNIDLESVSIVGRFGVR